jgi:hypothetical protein
MQEEKLKHAIKPKGVEIARYLLNEERFAKLVAGDE